MDRPEVDWYTQFPNDCLASSLGKLSEDKYQGTYTKDDIAAGLLKSYCTFFAKLALNHAKLNGVKAVVFTGSFLSKPVAKEILEECFYSQALFAPFFGGDPVRMTVVRHPGFLCALGTWLHNWELEQEYNTKAVE